MYYRIALQADASSFWKWKSTVLSSLNSVILWLQYFRVLPHDHLRIFTSSSPEALKEQLERENQGLGSVSIPVPQFLQERRLAPQEIESTASAGRTPENERAAFFAAISELSSPLEKRREELERGAGGDHDLPYRFTLPTSLPQALAWVNLMARVKQGDFHQVILPEEEQPDLLQLALLPEPLLTR